MSDYRLPTDILYTFLKKHPGAVILDKEDYEKYKFHKVSRNPGGYIKIVIEGKQILLHRLLTGFKYTEVDHKNTLPWDCRKENLREATREQNAANQGKAITNTSGYKGVCWHVNRRRWVASIRIDNKQVHLGCFKTAEQAAAAYKLAATKQRGEFVNLGN